MGNLKDKCDVFLVLSQFYFANTILPVTSVTPKHCSILGSDTNNMNRNQSKHTAIHNRLCLKNMKYENAFKQQVLAALQDMKQVFFKHRILWCPLDVTLFYLCSYKYNLPLL